MNYATITDPNTRRVAKVLVGWFECWNIAYDKRQRRNLNGALLFDLAAGEFEFPNPYHIAREAGTELFGARLFELDRELRGGVI